MFGSMVGSPCSVCTQKNSWGYSKETGLSNLEYIIRARNIMPDNNSVRFDWSISYRCKYGLSCGTLSSQASMLRRRASELDPYLTTIARCGDKQLLHECLRCLQGDFSKVYKRLEQEASNY